MALVGWNRGETAMNDYFSLRGVDYSLLTSHLPYNTRSLLNRFMAVAIIANQPERYGLEPVNYTEPDRFRVIKVKGGTRLSEVARHTGVSVQVLRDYNPAILHDRVPPGPSYELRLPLQESADARDAWRRADLLSPDRVRSFSLRRSLSFNPRSSVSTGTRISRDSNRAASRVS